MIIAAFLAITLDPAIRLLLMKTREFQFRPRWISWIANALLVGKFHSEGEASDQPASDAYLSSDRPGRA